MIVKKIIDYERSADFGPWRRRLNFVAGIGGFGLLADTAIESVARHFLTYGIPAGYQVSMTQASWRSPYCPDPRRFHQTTIERLNEGSSIWVYIGHGSEEQVDRVHVPGADYNILSAADVAELKCTAGAPGRNFPGLPYWRFRFVRLSRRRIAAHSRSAGGCDRRLASDYALRHVCFGDGHHGRVFSATCTHPGRSLSGR